MTEDERLRAILARYMELRRRGERAALEELCRDCPELVKMLRNLGEETACAGPASRGPEDAGRTVVTGADSPPGGKDMPGQDLPSVPGYELLEELGRGGMGVVYKARHVRLNRLVALKMVLAGAHAGPALRARFQIEAEAVASLRHPHIVQVYEVGEHERCPYLALEFVEGGGLDCWLDGRPVPPRDAAVLVEKLARAMHVAHLRGIIHRDLKPGNVLLASGGREPPDSGSGG
jgi:serine/threonine-protein kinase